MSFSFTGKCILLYFTLSICSLYFEIRSASCLTGNRNAKWHYLKHSLPFLFWILIVAFLFFIFSGNGRYEDPLSGLYLEMSISCLSMDLITHPLPSDIHSLILLISSLPASLITVSISFSLIISRALDLKKPLFTFSVCFIKVIFNLIFIFIPCFLFNSPIRKSLVNSFDWWSCNCGSLLFIISTLKLS